MKHLYLIPLSFLLASLLGGLLMLVGFYQLGMVVLACQRVESTQVNCTLMESRRLGGEPQVVELSHVQAIRLETYRCGENDGDSCYFLNFVTKEGEVHPHLTVANFNDTGSAEKISQFLGSKETRFTLEKKNESTSLVWAGGINALAFGLFSLGFFFFARHAIAMESQQ